MKQCLHLGVWVRPPGATYDLYIKYTPMGNPRCEHRVHPTGPPTVRTSSTPHEATTHGVNIKYTPRGHLRREHQVHPTGQLTVWTSSTPHGATYGVNIKYANIKYAPGATYAVNIKYAPPGQPTAETSSTPPRGNLRRQHEDRRQQFRLHEGRRQHVLWHEIRRHRGRLALRGLQHGLLRQGLRDYRRLCKDRRQQFRPHEGRR